MYVGVFKIALSAEPVLNCFKNLYLDNALFISVSKMYVFTYCFSFTVLVFLNPSTKHLDD